LSLNVVNFTGDKKVFSKYRIGGNKSGHFIELDFKIVSIHFVPYAVREQPGG